jgi:hypothetical protein
MYVKVDQWRESVPAFFRRIVSSLKGWRVKSKKESVAPQSVPALEYVSATEIARRERQ